MLPDTDVWTLDAADPDAAAGGLAAATDLWDGADVVGLGVTARTVRELHVMAHALVRLLVRDGIRAVLIEGDRGASEALDRFVRTGAGDPRAILARARPFLATRELLDLVRWLRHRNETDAGDPVRIVHGGADDLSGPEALERSLARQVTAWHERSGDRIVYLGGAVHTVGAERAAGTDGAGPVRSAGALLRDQLGTGYRSVGLTFGSGAIPELVPAPPARSVEARLDGLPHATTLVTARPDGPSPWAGADRVRFVGPGYDPERDADNVMVGDPDAWFDAVVHHKLATSVTFLD